MFNESIMTRLSAGRNLTDSHRDSPSSTSKIDNLIRSLVGMVAADPAPDPVPASARSATHHSGAQRRPPINGSIFGKRSVGNQTGASRQPGNHHPHLYQETRASDSINTNENSHDNAISPPRSSDSQQQKQQYLPKNNMPASTQGGNIKQLIAAKTPTTKATSEAINYKDIITEIIEDFLALNNESEYNFHLVD